MEVAVGDYGDHFRGRMIEAVIEERKRSRKLEENSDGAGNSDRGIEETWTGKVPRVRKDEFATSFVTQFRILFMRTFLSVLRNATLTKLRFVSNIAVGVMIGLLYYDIGNDGAKVFNNASFLFFCLLFILFTSLMPTVMTFPMEMGVFMHEHQNVWYSVKSYFIAKSMVDVPFQVIFPVMYGAIVYWMSGQPAELERFWQFLTLVTLTALVAQSFGLLIGAGVSLEVAVYLGPIVLIPMLLFCGFFLKLGFIHRYWRWLTYFSFLRYSFEGVLQAMYGMGRKDLNCTEEIPAMCPFTKGKDVLKHMSVDGAEFWVDFVVLVAFFVIVRVLCFGVLKLRLRFSKG